LNEKDVERTGSGGGGELGVENNKLNKGSKSSLSMHQALRRASWRVRNLIAAERRRAKIRADSLAKLARLQRKKLDDEAQIAARAEHSRAFKDPSLTKELQSLLGLVKKMKLNQAAGICGLVRSATMGREHYGMSASMKTFVAEVNTYLHTLDEPGERSEIYFPGYKKDLELDANVAKEDRAAAIRELEAEGSQVTIVKTITSRPVPPSEWKKRGEAEKVPEPVEPVRVAKDEVEQTLFDVCGFCAEKCEKYSCRNRCANPFSNVAKCTRCDRSKCRCPLKKV